jgi:hypothetical protein
MPCSAYMHALIAMSVLAHAHMHACTMKHIYARSSSPNTKGGWIPLILTSRHWHSFNMMHHACHEVCLACHVCMDAASAAAVFAATQAMAVPDTLQWGQPTRQARYFERQLLSADRHKTAVLAAGLHRTHSGSKQLQASSRTGDLATFAQLRST